MSIGRYWAPSRMRLVLVTLALVTLALVTLALVNCQAN
jgi:hypothetical protein